MFVSTFVWARRDDCARRRTPNRGANRPPLASHCKWNGAEKSPPSLSLLKKAGLRRGPHISADIVCFSSRQCCRFVTAALRVRWDSSPKESCAGPLSRCHWQVATVRPVCHSGWQFPGLSWYGATLASPIRHLQVAQVILKNIEEYWKWLVILMNIDTY